MKWLYFFLLGLGVGMILKLDLSGCNGKPTAPEQYYDLYVASQDSLRIIRKLNGEEVAKRKTYAATNEKLLKEVAKQSEELAEFQKIVKRFRNPVSVINHQVELKVEEKGDVQIVKEGNEIKYPIIAQKDDKHIFAKVSIYEDHSNWNLLTRANFNYGIEETKRGFLGIKGKTYELTATTDNPYFSTTDANSYTKIIKPSRVHVGFGAGIDVTLKPTVNLCVFYSLFEL